MNRGWRFCRPLPYRLATAPLKEVRRQKAEGTKLWNALPLAHYYFSWNNNTPRGEDALGWDCAASLTVSGLLVSIRMSGESSARVSRTPSAANEPRQLGCPPSPFGYGVASRGPRRSKNGAGNGIRTRDFDLGKVALYH